MDVTTQPSRPHTNRLRRSPVVANAGLILPVRLAHQLVLGELVDSYVDLVQVDSGSGQNRTLS